MLAYAARRREVASRQSSPPAMLIIISLHVALLAFVISAKMELAPTAQIDPPTKIVLIDEPLPPPEHLVKTTARRPQPTALSQPQPELPLPPVNQQVIESTTPIDYGKIFDPIVVPKPIIQQPVASPVRKVPRLLTPSWEIKPPYPQSKILSEEEAVLTLRLAIDESGRVVDVQPIGRADAAFLDAARRHLMAHWRYQPATEDGLPTASSITVTLRFQLDG